MRFALALVVALAASSASAQAIRVNSGASSSGGSFTGGTLTAPLILDASSTLCSQSLPLTWTGDTNMGFVRSAADSLVLCLNGAAVATYTTSGVTFATSATYTGAIIFSGVTDDIQSATGEDLSFRCGGTSGSAGGCMLQSRSDITSFLDSAGNTDMQVVTASGSTNALIRQGTATTTAGIRLTSSGAVLGSQSSVAATTAAAVLGDGIAAASSTSLFVVYGEGIFAPAGGAALSIGTTDTTTSPLGASSGCRMSAAGAAAWTPSETGAADKQMVWCTNTGTNVITMTESAGVYEGPTIACALGQWDTVSFEYVTDRWVQRSCGDN